MYTDHKNLTNTNFNTDRVMRWRLILEEYGPELIYTEGSTNIVADALSRLETEPTNESIAEAKNLLISEKLTLHYIQTQRKISLVQLSLHVFEDSKRPTQ